MNEPYDPAGKITEGEYESDVINDPTSPKRKRFSVPVWVMFFFILIVVLEVFCIQHFSDAFADYRVYATTDKRIADGDTTAAIADLYKLSTEHTSSHSVILKMIDVSMEYGYYDTAAYVMDNYLSGMNIKEPDYSRMNAYYTQLINYYKTCDAIDVILKANSAPQDSGDTDYSAITNSLEAMLEEPDQDYAVIHYYLGLLSIDDFEFAKNQLQQAYDMNPECFDVRVQLGVMYRRLGEYDKAEALNNEALHKDKSDSGALRSAAIILMLEGDMEGGAASAKKAYDAYPDGTFVRETYVIALTENNQEEEALKIQNEMTSVGEELDADTAKLLNGDITLENYYVSGQVE